MHRPEETRRPHGAPSLRRLHTTGLVALAFAIAACGGAPCTPPPAGSFEILQPFTSVGRDSIQDVAIDSDGDVYLAGYVIGAYLDVDHAGGRVAFALTTPRRFSEASFASFEGRVVVVDADGDGRFDAPGTGPRGAYLLVFDPVP